MTTVEQELGQIRHRLDEIERKDKYSWMLPVGFITGIASASAAAIVLSNLLIGLSR